MEDVQHGCQNCRIPSAGTWPPPVSISPPKADVAQVRLLTGKAWLDGVLGTGLFWLLYFALFKAASLVNDAYIAYVVRLPLFQEPLPFYVPWLGLGMLAVTLSSVIYASLHYFFPKIGRSFGQNILWMVGLMVILVPLMTWFR